MLRRRVLVASSLLIIAFWAVMTALLLRRELFTPHWQSVSSNTAVQPQDLWLGLLMNDKQSTPVGFVNLHTEPVHRGDVEGTETRVVGHMRLSLGEYKAELAVNGSMWATTHDGLREFNFSVRSGQHLTAVNGHVQSGRVVGEIDSGGEKLPLDLPVGKSLAFASAPGMGALTMPDIAVGQEVRVDTFDPLSMSMGSARVRCIGEETIQISGKQVRTKVFTTDLSGITSRAWVDKSGAVMRAETPLGFILQRMEPNEAMASTFDTAEPDEGLLRMAAIKPTGVMPSRGAREMTIQISSADGTLTLPVDESQVSKGNGQFSIAPLGPHPPDLPLPGPERETALANDSFLQITSPKIQQKAKEIVGAETDQWKKANLLYDWVYTAITKNIVPSVPTALDVLHTMEGDCNEHTMLFTALARAVDLPTRMAIGIVWSEEYQAFYYHAWPEVYVGRWIWMDPTLGQPVADATHIKLLNGDFSKWWQVAPFIGKLKIEVTAIQ